MSIEPLHELVHDDIMTAAGLAGSDGAVKTAVPSPKPVALWDLPGFDGKARVMTSFGALPIEALRVRDELSLPNGRVLKVAWIDQIKLDSEFLRRHPDARPFLIGACAFGTDLPRRNFLVSPQQEIHLDRWPSAGPARRVADLEGRRDILRKSSCEFIKYYIFHLGEPAEVSVEGVWCSVRP